MRFLDRSPFALSWVAPEPRGLERASHALLSDGRVWLVDPVDGDLRVLRPPRPLARLAPEHLLVGHGEPAYAGAAAAVDAAISGARSGFPAWAWARRPGA